MANETISFGDGSAYGFPYIEKEVYPSRANWTAAQAPLGTTTFVHAAVTDTGVPVTVTTSITNPAVARNVTATSGGTAGDIGAIQVTVTGTDVRDQVISEVLPIFTANSATTVVGSKAFKTITSFTVPAHDGTGATTSIGTGAKLGLYHYLNYNTVLSAALAGVKEGTAPTIATSLTSLSNNTMTLNSALNGTAVQAIYFKHFDQTLVG